MVGCFRQHSAKTKLEGGITMTQHSNWITLQKRFTGLHGLSWLAQEFADMILRRTVLMDSTIPVNDQECLWLLAALTCLASEKSNSCLNLQKTSDTNSFTPNAPDFEQLPVWAEPDVPNQSPHDFQDIYNRWTETLTRYPLTICQSDDLDSCAPFRLIHGTDGTDSLYLTRNRIAELELTERLKAFMDQDKCASNVTAQMVADSCTYFSNYQGELSNNHQVQAVVKALNVPFFIITGGPGTGKTTVLTVILAWHLLMNPNLDIALCAPTGKASKRMKEAVLDGVEKLQGKISEDIKEKLKELPESTLHSLLGIMPDTGLALRNPTNLLEADLVVVDECSMCDLSLMHQLLLALNPKAKLLLLGDVDQLASVENGTVFADLCRWFQAREKSEFLERLTECYRFPSASPLGGFVQAIITENGTPNYGEIPNSNSKGLYDGQTYLREGGVSCLFMGICPDDTTTHKKLQKRLSQWLSEEEVPTDKFTLSELLKMLLKVCGIDSNQWRKPQETSGWNERQWVAYFFNRAENVKILCAMHEGKWGVKSLNRAMQDCLDIHDRANGMPILITRNDKITRLQNGDVGIFYNKRIWFPKSSDARDGGMESIDDATKKLLGKYADMSFVSFEESQLPPHENAFAMTIHKSQGSGYDNVLLFLPEKDNPILTRELVYTGITRTQRNCIVIADKQVMQNAIKRKTMRWTGIQALLDDRIS